MLVSFGTRQGSKHQKVADFLEKTCITLCSRLLHSGFGISPSSISSLVIQEAEESPVHRSNAAAIIELIGSTFRFCQDEEKKRSILRLITVAWDDSDRCIRQVAIGVVENLRQSTALAGKKNREMVVREINARIRRDNYAEREGLNRLLELFMRDD